MAKHSKFIHLSALIMVFLLLFTGCSSKAEETDLQKIHTANSRELEIIHSSAEMRKQCGDNMLSTIKKLSEKDGARVTGFSEAKASIEFITNEFKQMGLSVKAQEFPITASREKSKLVKIITSKEKTIEARYWSFSTGTPAEGIKGEVVFADDGFESDVNSINLKGKIALFKRGGEPTFEKVRRVANAGAIAALFYNPDSNELMTGTLVNHTKIPALLIKDEDAKVLEKTIAKGKKASAFIQLNVEMKKSTSENIIAEIDVTKKYPDAKTLIIGAHYDSVDTPGANDNASGVAVMMESARILSKLDLKCNIRFIAFGSEEIDLQGARYYVRTLTTKEWGNIIGMVNLDMVGQGEVINIGAIDRYAKYPMLALAKELLIKNNYTYEKTILDSSDSVPFEEAHIQVTYFENNPYTAYHSKVDTLEKIKPEIMVKTLETVVNMGIEIGENPEKYRMKK